MFYPFLELKKNKKNVIPIDSDRVDFKHYALLIEKKIATKIILISSQSQYIDFQKKHIWIRNMKKLNTPLECNIRTLLYFEVRSL